MDVEAADLPTGGRCDRLLWCEVCAAESNDEFTVAQGRRRT